MVTLNSLYTYNSKARLALTTLIVFITVVSLCCGKRKPPVPPTERIAQRAVISGYQQGSKINLSWKMPARNSSETDTQFIERIDVYRLAEPLSAPDQITEEEFSSRSTLIDTIPVGDQDFSLQNYTYTDNLQFSTQPARLRYAIKFVNNSGQKAAFSNFLTIQPSPRIAKNPDNLSAKVAQDTITIYWSKPTANVDNSVPVNILGFNLYRKSNEGAAFQKLNQQPVSDSRYNDTFFDFENKYTYYVRTVSLGANGEPVESVDSPSIEIIPKDTFPPNPPDSITVAASPNTLSIFFATNAEKDVVGYKVFRSTDSQLSLDRWQILTPEIINRNTYIDRNVSTGVRYYYYLVAIDKYGNESQPSIIVNEVVP